MKRNPTESARPRKPKRSKKAAAHQEKPYAEFPLYAHPLGYWSKKIDGKLVNFGRWGRMQDGVVVPVEDYAAGWRDALASYKVRIDDIRLGKDDGAAPVDTTRVRLNEMLNRVRTDMKRRADAREISARMHAEYVATCDRLIDLFGGSRVVSSLDPTDFGKLYDKLKDQYGPVRLGNEVQKVKTVFNYAAADRRKWIERVPDFGEEFRKPDARTMRRHRQMVGKRKFDAADVRALIDAAGVPLRAIILLGINAGFGNADAGRLRLSSLDLDRGWYHHHREKTWIERRAKLWPQTITAIREALADRTEREAKAKSEDRPFPAEGVDPETVFVTRLGGAWATGDKADNAITGEFSKLLKKIGITKASRPGLKLSFYSLRHTARTVANGMGDKNRSAIRKVMGHADGGEIDDVYIEEVSDEQLEAVANHIHAWLYPEPEPAKDDADAGTVRMPKRPGAKPAPTGKPTRPTLRLFVEGGAA